MIILEQDGSFVHPDNADLPDPSTTRGLVEISADLALRQNTIIDRILAYLFDTLGLHAVELRIYEERTAQPG